MIGLLNNLHHSTQCLLCIYVMTNIYLILFKQIPVEFLKNRGIPVFGHIGFLPQTVNNYNNVSIKGFTKEEEDLLLTDAEHIEKAGAIAIVLEAVAKDAAKKNNIKSSDLLDWGTVKEPKPFGAIGIV